MSWEYWDSKYPCPCGKSTYTETTGSNDWGQSSVSWKMDCPSCKENYALYVYRYNRKGMSCEGHRWVRRQKYEKAMKFQKDAKDLRNRSIKLAKDRYLPALVDQFKDSSKKAIWSVLHENIKWYKSLGTFYQHTKGKDKPEYLGELFCDYYIDDVFKIMGVRDEEIQEIRAKAENLEKDAEKLLREE